MVSYLALVGGLTVTYFLVQVGLFIYQSFVYKSTSVKKLLDNKQWAVVTGATAGIGEGFTYELAKRGVNVLAVGRSEQKLKNVAKEVTDKYKGVEVRPLIIDFANEKPEEYSKKLSDAISSLQVSVLVNNVGVNNTGNLPFLFLDQDNSDFKALIDVNINATLYVTKAVLPKLVQNPSGGLVLNLSSYTAKYPTPMNAVYSATKAFVDVWSQSLATEYASKKVRVYSLLPMWVKSDMTGFRKTSLAVCSGQKLACDTLNSVDAPLLPLAFSPFYVHKILMALFAWIPEKVLAKQALGTMTTVRKKLLARAERSSDSNTKKQD